MAEVLELYDMEDCYACQKRNKHKYEHTSQHVRDRSYFREDLSYRVPTWVNTMTASAEIFKIVNHENSTNFFEQL